MNLFRTWNIVARCCLTRLKRALFLSVFLTFTSVLIVSVFYFMNQDHAQLHAIRDRLKGGHGMGPEHINMLNLHKEMAISRHRKENGEEPKERPVCIHIQTYKYKWYLKFFYDGFH